MLAYTWDEDFVPTKVYEVSFLLNIPHFLNYGVTRGGVCIKKNSSAMIVAALLLLCGDIALNPGLYPCGECSVNVGDDDSYFM